MLPKKETFKRKDPWKLHKDKIRKTIINKKNLLRRNGYHSAALSPDVAITAANSMTGGNSTNHSEIWQLGK